MHVWLLVVSVVVVLYTSTSQLTFGLFFFFFFCMLVWLQKFHLHHRVYGEHLWNNFCECF